MADKVGAKKPLVSPGGAKNIAAAKAAFGAGGVASNGAAGSPQSRTRTAEATKNEDPKTAVTLIGKAVGPAAQSGPTQAVAVIKEAVLEEVKPTAVAPSAKSQLAASTISKKQAVSDESSSASSSDEDSDESSDEDSDVSDRKSKPKKIDIGVSLSSIKAAFQQDDKSRQQNIKKGYDVEEFKRQCKQASELGGTGTEGTVENDPAAQNPDVIKNAVQNDLGLDGIKSSAKDIKSRFENYSDSHAESGKGNEELQQLKERSEVSGQKSKWENPEALLDRNPKPSQPDIEVSASKATKMKEKFEKKARKEEKKNKTPRPKHRTSIQADHHE
ncbi:hypothetical protein BV898_00054 [Hypsibius exemplaris]|uniref:Uncharacterized protein n=1 Tax=Hypsibius exemplaris TaxID=2072580 RepID=A0A1W0XEW7_HYPEX|nr:hypothetical protein BV898_00054 [Hypsibius exemplaris]